MRRLRWFMAALAPLLTLVVAGALPAAGMTPAPASVAALSWDPCPDAAGPHAAQCADMRVPLSWSKPHGTTISLHLSKLPALDPAHRVGVLLFNPGGPGTPGAAPVATVGRSLFPKPLQDRFDIIGFDPRGVGQSTAVQCVGPALGAGVPVFPRSVGQFAALVRQSASYATGCAAHSAPGLLSNVDTISAARDIDSIRAALGERRINWLGVSYGTYLGQTYARMFPHRLRAMVLDGAIDHAVGPRDFLQEEASSLSDVFGRFAQWCQASTTCALHGKDVLADWDRLLDRASTRPVPAPNATGGATAVTADAVLMALPSLLQFGPTSSVTTWPTLAQAIAGAWAGDASMFADNSAIGQPQPAYAAVSCQDFPPQFHGYPDVAERLAAVRAVSPHTDGVSEAWEMSALCAGWPGRPADPWGYRPVVGAPPILVASAAHDPSTPLVWAQGLHREIAGSGLLTADVTGHTAFFHSACARSVEAEYLISGRLPTNGRCGA